jgi:hypothetical protein
MKSLLVKYENHQFIVYDGEAVYGWIVFEPQSVIADIHVNNIKFRTRRGDDKNIELTQDGKTIFKFKFDYLWGNAEIEMNGEDTGYDIKGKWFKKGTRLTDENDADIVVAVTKELPEYHISLDIIDEQVEPVMVMATLYYHIYASAGKTFGLVMAMGTNAGL